MPQHLDLRLFVGSALAEAVPLENIFYFRFQPAAPSRFLPAPATQPEVGVEGKWVLSSPAGEVLVSGSPIPPSLASVRALLGVRIASSQLHVPTSFSLIFETGHRLEFFDSDPTHETLSVSPGNVFI